MSPRESARQHVLRESREIRSLASECEKGALILERTHDSADAILLAFELVRQQRGNPRGVLTDNEQDLLRAMLVMAAAGLDSMVKQLIRDALPRLARADDTVREELEKFIARSIRGDPALAEPANASKFFARILAAGSTQAKVIEEYVRDLTGGSLQSTSELNRVTAALGVQGIHLDQIALRGIFDVRNKIIHELDINLSGDRRRRNDRGIEDMKRFATTLIETAELILEAVHGKLQTLPPDA
jgi:hypothetical protein